MSPQQTDTGGLSPENAAVLSAQVGYPMRKRHTMFEGDIWQLQSWFEAIRADERARFAASLKPVAWRYEFSIPRQEDVFRDGTVVWHAAASIRPPRDIGVRNLTPLFDLGRDQ